MIDIMTMSVLDIQRDGIKRANGGYIPEDLLSGGSSTMLNIDKGSVYSHPLTIVNEQVKARKRPEITCRPSTYSERTHGRSVLRDTPSVFLPGSMPKLAASPAKAGIIALGKLRAYCAAHSEDTEELDSFLEGYGLERRHLTSITPVTTSERTKPWALDDLPRSRNMTGGYNLMQNVRVQLGNYRSGVNTQGRSIDYQRVASLLRSVAMQLFGYEPWSYEHFSHLDFSLNYHLNLDEFPRVSHLPFISEYLLHMVMVTFFPPVTGSEISLLTEYIDTIDLSRRHLHLVPISSIDPNIKMAQKELLHEQKSTRQLAPYFSSASFRDISTPAETFRTFELLDTKESDMIARRPGNILQRLLTPWLQREMQDDIWPHTVMTLADAGNLVEAASEFVKNLDPRIPRLTFDILGVLNPAAWDTWKRWFRWLFLSMTTIPVLHIKDPTHAFLVSLKENPTVVMRVYLASYREGLKRHSKFSMRDFLVPEDSDVPSTLDSLQTKLYKRISHAYTLRYKARAEQSIRVMRGLTKRVGHRTRKVSDLHGDEKKKYEEARNKVARYQWRVKMYPMLVPSSFTDTSFDEDKYLTATMDRVSNYLRKRGKIIELNAVERYQEYTLLTYVPFKDQMDRLSDISKLSLWEDYNDICEKRGETIADIHNFLRYETNVTLPTDSPLDDAYENDSWASSGLSDESDDEVPYDPFSMNLADHYKHQPAVGGHNALFSRPMGLASVKAVRKLYWKDTMAEEGYTSYWVREVADVFGLGFEDVVELPVMEEIRSWLKENWYIRYKNPGEHVYDTEADIV